MSEDIESRVPKVNPSQPPSDRTDDASLIYMKHNIQQAMYVQIYSLHIYVQLMYVRMYNSDVCAFIQLSHIVSLLLLRAFNSKLFSSRLTSYSASYGHALLGSCH